MRLTKLQIRQFGKVKDQEIRLQDGINVIYGPNESGKSTLHSYIRAMFFGLPRYRGRAARTDPYNRFEPWERPMDFGGQLEFSAGGKIFRLERNFYKGDPRESLICITDGEQMSIHQGDLTMLLGGISESIYDNTVSVGQLRSETDEGMVRELQKYMSNYEGTGAQDVDLQRAGERLKKKKREWEAEKGRLQEEHTHRIEQLEEKIFYVEKECQKLHGQEEQAREQGLQWERKAQELEQRLFRMQTVTAGSEQEENGRRIEEPELSADTKFWQPVLLIGIFLLLAAGVCLYQKWLIPGILTGILSVFIFWAAQKIRSREERKRRRRQVEARERETVLSEKRRLEEERNERKRALEESRRQRSLCAGRQELLQQQTEEKGIILQNLREELEELRESEEGVRACEVEIQSLDLALEVLGKLAGEMRMRIGGRLKNRMEEILGEVTEGKYSRISIDQEMRITVWEWNREVSLYQLSRGTVEQIYFALRMAASEILCEEPMPVLLDDVFAMYDEQRLRQTLGWLSRRSGQVLLFTCHRREMELLQEMQIAVNEIDLEEKAC